MANEIRTGGNSFLERAARIRSKTGIDILPPAEPKNRNTPKAPLNFVPDEGTLGSLIHNALSALSRGVRWARGSILNLLV